MGADEFLFKQAQLQEEELFELEPPCGFLEGVLVGREMDVPDGVLQAAEGVFGEDVFGKGFSDFRKTQGQGGALKLAHHLAGDASVDEFFGTGIDAGEAALKVGAFGQGSVHLRVHHVEFSVEERWLAEEDENGVRHQLGVVPLDALEEHHFHLACGVFHDDAEALNGVLKFFVSGRDYAAAGAVHCTAYDPGFYLNIGLFAGDFGDAVEAAAVDVAVRVDAEQFAHGGNAQLRLDECRSFGPHPGDVLYVAVQVAHGVKIVIYSYFRKSVFRLIQKKSSSGKPSGPTIKADVMRSAYSCLKSSYPDVSSALLLLTSMATSACPFFRI